ncbi:MAG: hypothetical protein R3A52_28695 [Polyangiales bacterium]
MKEPFPPRLIDPASPTRPKLRALLQSLAPDEVPPEVEERISENLQASMAREDFERDDAGEAKRGSG